MIAESKNLSNLRLKIKVESEKVGLLFYVKKTEVMAKNKMEELNWGEEELVGVVDSLVFLGSKMHSSGD